MAARTNPLAVALAVRRALTPRAQPPRPRPTRRPTPHSPPLLPAQPRLHKGTHPRSQAQVRQARPSSQANARGSLNDQRR